MKSDKYTWHSVGEDDPDLEERFVYEEPATPEAFEEQKSFVDANIWEKVERVGKKISILKDVKALYAYLSDGKVVWYRKTIVVAALVYFISPIDAIPDIAPLIGYLDDMGVIAAVLKYLGHELKAYYE